MQLLAIVLALTLFLSSSIGQTILIDPPDDLSSSIYIPCKVSGNGNKIFGVRCDTLTSTTIKSFVWWDKDGEIIAERYAPQYCNRKTGSLSYDGNSVLAWANNDNLNEVYRVSPAVVYFVGQNIFTDLVSRPPLFATGKDVFGMYIECQQEFTLPTLYAWNNGHYPDHLMLTDCDQTRLWPAVEWSPLLPMIGYLSGDYGIWYWDAISQSIQNHLTLSPANYILAVDDTLSYAIINQDLVSLEDMSARSLFSSESSYLYALDSNIPTTSGSLKIINHGHYQIVIGNTYDVNSNSTWIFNSRFDGQTVDQFLSRHGFLPPNFTVKQITGISADGKRICGMGEENGLSRGFISKIFFTRPPCLGDYNNDGAVESADIECFYLDWALGIADINGDAVLDEADLQEFWAAWESGSC